MSDQHLSFSEGNLPVGYWIKQADNLLTKGINEIQASFGIKRLEWQILDFVYKTESTPANEVTKALKPFADAVAVIDLLQKYVDRKIMINQDHAYSLTQKGTELYKLCLERQTNFRRKAARNISPEDYEATIKALKQLVTNLTEED